jgi:hypothetical protein
MHVSINAGGCMHRLGQRVPRKRPSTVTSGGMGCSSRLEAGSWGKLPGGTVRKKAVFGPQSADNFSELSLMEKTLPLPFQAEYEGSIPFTRSNVTI